MRTPEITQENPKPRSQLEKLIEDFEAGKLAVTEDRGDSPVEDSFKWRQANGQFIPPSDMKTSHIVYALRLIWNKYMPTKAPGKAGSSQFANPYYTHTYLGQSWKSLWAELDVRDDLNMTLKHITGHMRQQIAMLGYTPAEKYL